jgi:hypothetical protein
MIQQIVAGSNRGEHLPDSRCCRVAISRTGRSRTDYSLIDFLIHNKDQSLIPRQFPNLVNRGAHDRFRYIVGNLNFSNLARQDKVHHTLACFLV